MMQKPKKMIGWLLIVIGAGVFCLPTYFWIISPEPLYIYHTYFYRPAEPTDLEKQYYRIEFWSIIGGVILVLLGGLLKEVDT